jgi:hypothetical protein
VSGRCILYLVDLSIPVQFLFICLFYHILCLQQFPCISFNILPRNKLSNLLCPDYYLCLYLPFVKPFFHLYKDTDCKMCVHESKIFRISYGCLPVCLSVCLYIIEHFRFRPLSKARSYHMLVYSSLFILYIINMSDVVKDMFLCCYK